MKIEDIREEFTTYAMREDIGFEISLCGLCANSGIVDTRKSAVWNDQQVGILGYCLCANGRALKRSRPNLLAKDMEGIQSSMARKMFRKNSQ